MMNFVLRVRLLAAFALFAVILAACGGEGAGSAFPSYDFGDASSESAAPPAPATAAGGTDYDFGAPAGSGQDAAGQPGSGGTGSSGAPAPSPTNPDAQQFNIVPEQSKATYHARQETFVPGLGAEVDGSTSDVTGTISFDPQNPSRSQIDTVTVHVDTLNSGIELRDQRLQGEFLESGTFPIATFKSTRLEGLPDAPYMDGQELHFRVVGDLTIHDVTREVSFDATATITGDTLTSTATTTIMMTDFGIEVPDLLNFVRAENTVGLELSITAQRA